MLPGEEKYNDFWQVNKVTVPSDYVANEVTSQDDILEAGYKIEATSTIANCPVIPAGSTARRRGGGESAELTRGWYKGKVASYLNFEEAPLAAAGNAVPLSPTYVTFWLVSVYDSKDFDDVGNRATVTDSKNVDSLAQGAANVNCREALQLRSDAEAWEDDIFGAVAASQAHRTRMVMVGTVVDHLSARRSSP